jgi:hypothetical protein
VTDNHLVRRPILGVSTVCLALLSAGLAGCGAPAPPDPGPVALPTGVSDRDRLAGLAVQALGRHYVATYTLSSPGRPDRTITVAVATDGTWIVGVPGGALGGLADIAIFKSSSGLQQCLLGPAAGTADSGPGLGPLTPSCVVVSSLPPADDPRVQHVFTDWIDPLVDRATALSVTATTLAGADGSCFSVESTSAALAPPLDPGIYCFADDGTLTGAKAGFGTLLPAGAVGAAPPTIAQPAPVVANATPVPTAASSAP